jgi:ferrochelatase
MNESSPIDPHGATAMGSDIQPATPAPAGSRIGVLIVNLGTPDTADAPGVRRYLREFLSDPRVIENQGLLWQAILNGVILQIRPRIKARDYQKIWNKERNESPLKTITRAQAEQLKLRLASCAAPLEVDWAMRYGNPSIESRLKALSGQGCERILMMSLYPQYSAATTATVADEVFRVLKAWRRQPTLRFAAPYYDDRAYIEALAVATRAELAKLSFEPEVILASFHGMPQDYINKGDPYFEHCVETMRLLRARLGLDENKLMLTFQSRFGRAKWLEPATDKTVKELARRGVRNLAVITPGFSADCLETLEEIAVENAHIFRDNGGENFFAVPCLNDSEPGMLMLGEIALRELKGWI